MHNNENGFLPRSCTPSPNQNFTLCLLFFCSKKMRVFFVLFLRAGWRTSMSVSLYLLPASPVCFCLSTWDAPAHWEFWIKMFWMLLVPSSACLPGTCLSVQEERKGHKIQPGCLLSFLCASWLLKNFLKLFIVFISVFYMTVIESNNVKVHRAKGKVPVLTTFRGKWFFSDLEFLWMT